MWPYILYLNFTRLSCNSDLLSVFVYSGEIAILPEISLNPRSILAENRSAVYNTVASRQFYNPLLSLTIFKEYFILPVRISLTWRENIASRWKKSELFIQNPKCDISLWRLPQLRCVRHNSIRCRIFLIGSRARHRDKSVESKIRGAFAPAVILRSS